nr:uncharacterized protein LOC128699921 isoform X2 [Cherax quadricarinatus]
MKGSRWPIKTLLAPLMIYKFINAHQMGNVQVTVTQEGEGLNIYERGAWTERRAQECRKRRSSGRAYGALKDNTIPSGSHSCPGIPFANINKNHVGRYTCLLHDSNATASFNVSYCKDGDKLDVWLSKGGQKVDCVSPDERKVDDYCLELKLHDSTRPSDFQCKFKEDVVYTCTNFNDCKESSALAERGAVPRSVSQKCSGIPFANMDRHFFGSYSCSSQDSTGAEVSGLHIISICKEESLLRPPKKTEREMKTSRGNLFRQD